MFFLDSSTYIILRELHKVEMALARESEINRIIQQVIDIMISDDAGVEDIRADVEIPEGLGLSFAFYLENLANFL